MTKKLKVVQMLPELESGGVERGTLEIGKYLVDHGHTSIVISSGGQMVDQLIREGSEHINWEVGKKSLFTLRYIKKVRKFLLETKPDILHLRSRLPAWIGYLAWKKMPKNNRPHLVTTVHGTYTVGKYSSVMVRGEGVIAVSNMIRDYIITNYPFVNPNDITVNHRGVDHLNYTPDFRPSKSWKSRWYEEFPQMQDKYLITIPARLTRRKGQEDFIEIIDTLIQEGKPVHGVIVGSTHPRKREYAEELQNTINYRGLQKEITMVGHRHDLKEILSLSQIVLSLSREPEAFGRTTIEALSLGIPVIGYDHGGVSEQLHTLLPEGAVQVANCQQVCDTISAWVQSPPVPLPNTTFTLESMCSKTQRVYEKFYLEGK